MMGTGDGKETHVVHAQAAGWLQVQMERQYLRYFLNELQEDCFSITLLSVPAVQSMEKVLFR